VHTHTQGRGERVTGRSPDAPRLGEMARLSKAGLLCERAPGHGAQAWPITVERVQPRLRPIDSGAGLCPGRHRDAAKSTGHSLGVALKQVIAGRGS
jgi:hypothetical protein